MRETVVLRVIIMISAMKMCSVELKNWKVQNQKSNIHNDMGNPPTPHRTMSSSLDVIYQSGLLRLLKNFFLLLLLLLLLRLLLLRPPPRLLLLLPLHEG